ncbi:hypothetical protein V1478_016912 [Vespula squamosa]|uniref:Uncharacterized protein n=1 Tax=Vespula squamosa TaxID=30214 RepID=A0ABD1ZXW2_VESSQ
MRSNDSRTSFNQFLEITCMVRREITCIVDKLEYTKSSNITDNNQEFEYLKPSLGNGLFTDPGENRCGILTGNY